MYRTAVIGVGNMGSRYASILQDGLVTGMELAALTRVKDPYRELLHKSLEEGVPVFESADKLFDAVEKGNLKIDAVIIATPHYAHEEIAVRAFRNGLHVLCDKPSGVYSKQARLMEEAADRSGKVFSMVFNQRTLPIYIKLKEIVSSGKVVTCGSYNSKIAKVDKNGKVTGVSAGTTSIYVKANGLTKVIPITVYANRGN
jgi:predicted dehydrogenase